MQSTLSSSFEGQKPLTPTQNLLFNFTHTNITQMLHYGKSLKAALSFDIKQISSPKANYFYNVQQLLK